MIVIKPSIKPMKPIKLSATLSLPTGLYNGFDWILMSILGNGLLKSFVPTY